MVGFGRIREKNPRIPFRILEESIINWCIQTCGSISVH